MTSLSVVMVTLLTTLLCSWAHCASAKHRDRLLTVKDEAFHMAFRIQPGLRTSAYARFMDTGSNDDSDPLQLDFEVPCGCKGSDGRLSCDRHFRSRLLDRWEHLPIDKVRVGVYKDGVERQYLLFDGRNSTFTDWFSKRSLIASSYTDLTPSAKTDYFSIEGDGRQDRRFFIHTGYHGCDQDMGWLVVVDGPTYPCPSWEKQGDHYPAILFSPYSTITNYTGSVGVADVLIVSVSFHENNCYSMPL